MALCSCVGLREVPGGGHHLGAGATATTRARGPCTHHSAWVWLGGSQLPRVCGRQQEQSSRAGPRALTGAGSRVASGIVVRGGCGPLPRVRCWLAPGPPPFPSPAVGSLRPPSLRPGVSAPPVPAHVPPLRPPPRVAFSLPPPRLLPGPSSGRGGWPPAKVGGCVDGRQACSRGHSLFQCWAWSGSAALSGSALSFRRPAQRVRGLSDAVPCGSRGLRDTASQHRGREGAGGVGSGALSSHPGGRGP